MCGCKNATMVMKINRPKREDNIISFQVCNDCLAKMKKEIEICE